MKIRVLTIGKKHEPWVSAGITEFSKRLRPPFLTEIIIVPNATRPAQAVDQESAKLLGQIHEDDWVILLDERGKNLSSPELSEHLVAKVDRQVVIVIGGAFGVSDQLRKRANLVWSLSRLVLPHQLVRLVLIEQLYRAQEIQKGSGYHHI